MQTCSPLFLFLFKFCPARESCSVWHLFSVGGYSNSPLSWPTLGYSRTPARAPISGCPAVFEARGDFRWSGACATRQKAELCSLLLPFSHTSVLIFCLSLLASSRFLLRREERQVLAGDGQLGGEVLDPGLPCGTEVTGTLTPSSLVPPRECLLT